MIKEKARRIREVDDLSMARELEECLGKDADSTIAEGLESSSDLYSIRSIVSGIVVDDLDVESGRHGLDVHWTWSLAVLTVQ